MCAGSIAMIHHKCLKEWIQQKQERRETTTCLSIQWFNISCELCKTVFPEKVHCSKNNKVYRIFDFTEPETLNCPYLVLHSVMELKKTKIVHIINTVQSKITTVGRQTDVDLRIPDISVSRKQAKIEFIQGAFYLSDSNSKFGTLHLIKYPVHIHKDNLEFLTPY